MLKKRSFLLLLIFLIWLLPIRTNAWNGTGHMVIAAIAYRQLPEEKQKTLTELLKSHPDYDTWMANRPEPLPDNDLGLYLFMRASTWPDVIRGSLEYEKYHHPKWHFIDIPLASAVPNPIKLPHDQENILSAIERSETLLSDASKSLEERAIYLSWLIHLVGDIHQPLHCVTKLSPTYPEGDRGGNMVYVNVADESVTRRLHSIWDGLLGGTLDEQEGNAVTAVNIISNIPNLSIADLRSGTTPKEWLEQSVLIAFNTVYMSGTLPVGREGNPVSLPAEYIDTARAVANKRAVLAGVRLADTLKDLKAQPAPASPGAGVPTDDTKTGAPDDPSLLHRLLLAIKERSALFSVAALAVLLMIVLSTRLISILLKLDLWGLKQIAPAFYLFSFGRWKLYRDYRKRLSTGVGLIADLKHGVEHYIDLPFTSNPALDPNLKLSDVFTTLPVGQRVVIEAEGGRGKSTLCYYLARRCVERRDLFGGKLLEPVVVDGLTYAGNMLQAITAALSKGAYVNQTIVESQLAAGNLLVILEGFSEIREAHLVAASSTELPDFIKQLRNTPFIITSRTSLPPDLGKALSDPLTIRICDVDATTERLFLSHYLKEGEKEVDFLIKQIKERFSDLPRIPLMLKLVAAIYDEKEQIPKNTATLFDKYTRQLLREEATGIKYITGLFFAINHLVSETHLRNGDRGFTENRGVELLRKIKDDLEARNIKLSPIDLLEILKRAGLYKQVGRNLRFFHDSFESYFGARALESDFGDGKYDLLLQCVGNNRLAETWRFLDEMLDAPEDKQQLQKLLQQQLTKTVEQRTVPEVKQVNIDQQQYEATKEHHIHILHLSDLHFGDDTFAGVWRTQLESDLIRELGTRKLEYLVISGDIANRSTEKEYDVAFTMVDGLVKRFGLDPGRIVVVPGNHDLNWELSEGAYAFVPSRKLPTQLPEERCIPAGDAGVLLRDESRYRERFAHFNNFYRRIYYGQDYPLDYADQVLFVERPEDRILFLGLNSSWQLDHHFRDRPGIHMPALTRALDRLQDGKHDGWLKVAVWHHPVTGKEMMNDEFIQLLAVHGFQICLHGHIHEARQGFHDYDDRRKIHIIGAGTFGAPAHEQITGIPLQYNLLTFDPKTGEMTVKTRKKEKLDGAWSADARWGDRNDPKPWYRFTVPNYHL